MIECLESLSLHIKQVLQYSGRSLNYLGQYNQCLQIPGMVYNLAYVTMKGQPQSMVGEIGLCLPKQCKETSIRVIFDQIFTFIHYPLEIAYVNDHVQDYHYENNWAFYLTLVIIVSLLILTVVSTFYKQRNLLNVFNLKETQKVFKRNPQSKLNVLNGVKSISMMWVVLGHTISTLIGQSVNLQTSVEQNTLLTPFFLFVEGGFFSVDVFFFVAGLLLAYIVLKQKVKSLSTYGLAILQRILRFWPSYFLAMLIYYGVYLHMGSGPNWAEDQLQVGYCNQMWKSLLFVDNLVDNGQKMCMGWGWYIQNDMQLFVVSIFLLFFYSKSPKISKSLTLLLTLGSLIWTFVWTYKEEIIVITHMADGGKWGLYFNDVYIKPWARAPPYLIGLFLGIIYHEFLVEQKKLQQIEGDLLQHNSLLMRVSEIFKQNRTFRVLTELLGIIMMLFLILIPRTLQQEITWPQWAHSSYQALAKFIFVLSLFLTILPSILGFRNSFIQNLLDTNLFNFIAKISFCTYLLHLNVIFIWFYSRSYSRYFTIIPAIAQYFGILLISLCLGFMMTIFVEISFSKLQKKLIFLMKSKTTVKSLILQKNSSSLSQQIQQSLNINKSLISIQTQPND